MNMLEGKELGAAIKKAIDLKIKNGSIKYQTEVAKHFGIKPPSIHDWYNKGSISKTNLFKLFEYCSDVVGPDHWGIEKFPAPDEVVEFEDGPSLSGFSSPPVVGRAIMGVNGFYEEIDYPVGHGDGYVDAPTADPNAYALRVVGDSMSPAIKNGWYVVCEPNREAHVGDYVLVKTTDGRSMVKELRSMKKDGVVLSSVNNGYEDITLTWGQIDKMHAVPIIVSPSKHRL